jgi:hypothetical protein
MLNLQILCGALIFCVCVATTIYMGIKMLRNVRRVNRFFDARPIVNGTVMNYSEAPHSKRCVIELLCIDSDNQMRYIAKYKIPLSEKLKYPIGTDVHPRGTWTRWDYKILE